MEILKGGFWTVWRLNWDMMITGGFLFYWTNLNISGYCWNAHAENICNILDMKSKILLYLALAACNWNNVFSHHYITTKIKKGEHIIRHLTFIKNASWGKNCQFVLFSTFRLLFQYELGVCQTIVYCTMHSYGQKNSQNLLIYPIVHSNPQPNSFPFAF
jgi:hypothetical protein